MADSEIVRALADRQTITDLIYRYCRAVDRLDIPLGHSIWHDDAIADYGADYYQGRGKGVIDLICKHHGHTLHHSHQVTNIIIDLDGDCAGSEAYVIAALRLPGEPLKQIMVWSRYVDSWSRRDGRWGLAKRIAIREFDEIREVTETKRFETGKRDRTDPSYAVLRDPT